MSIEAAAFTSEGYKSFPNTHSDMRELSSVVDWPDKKLEYKLSEYNNFIDREDIMPRARKAANYILEHMLFEQACRYGAYQSIDSAS